MPLCVAMMVLLMLLLVVVVVMGGGGRRVRMAMLILLEVQITQRHRQTGKLPVVAIIVVDCGGSDIVLSQ